MNLIAIKSRKFIFRYEFVRGTFRVTMPGYDSSFDTILLCPSDQEPVHEWHTKFP